MFRGSARLTLLVGLFCAALLTFPLISLADHRLANKGHWSRHGHPQAHMDVVDRTGNAWPVYASQIRWNEVTNGISAQYASNGSQCAHHCVGVAVLRPAEDPYNIMYPDCRGSAGYATVGGPFVGAQDHFNEKVRIRYNQSCASRLTRRDRRALTCQEQGHALGLTHRNSPDSCMFQDPTRADRAPDEHDRHTLNQNIYDHQR